MSDEAPVTRWTVAVGWVGLILLLGWQEFYVEIDYSWPTPWWFRVPFTLMLGLSLLVFPLECLMQEMTVRRWAVSLVVFLVTGLAVGSMNSTVMITTQTTATVPTGRLQRPSCHGPGRNAEPSRSRRKVGMT